MDPRIQELVSEVEQGFLTRRDFVTKAAALGLSYAAATELLGGVADAEDRRGKDRERHHGVRPKKWQRGRGWGWVWGPDDEVGALNELTPALAHKALRIAHRGGLRHVYDLGLTYDRRSFRWPGHAPGEIVTFRSPQGELIQKDLDFMFGPGNTSNTAFASCYNHMSDNVATQIDTLGHIYAGEDLHAYNGFQAADIVGDWGLLKLGVETIPPIVAPATLIDVAGFVGEQALPAGFAIQPDLLRATLRQQRVDIDVLDVVLIRTGTAGVWLRGDQVGANHEELEQHESAGITVASARWLVEQKGAVAVGSDTTGLEVVPPVDHVNLGTSFNPVHVYLLVQQGVHILEFHNLEQLADDRVYKFAYILGTNKIKGNTAGTVVRPVAMA